MTNLLYVAVPVVLVLLVSVVMAARGRRPTSVESGVEEFSRGLRALAPEDVGSRKGRRHRRAWPG
ncbi:MAG TPA: hypothetical protein VGL32_13920 [Acidimicrobiales bacterium]